MSAMDTDNHNGEEEIVENPTLKAAYNQEPLHHNQLLDWDYKVDLIGEKIYDKVIHLCEICELPVLVYGRMLPCKHIFCFDCARKCEKTCKRCGVRVQKVEKSALGTVYVCTHGAPKHSVKGCRRTYLSHRDLQSHIAHRHVPKPSSEVKSSAVTSVSQSMMPQLPLTQQQAALQQAAQMSSQPAPVPLLSVQSPAPPVLMPHLTEMTSPQTSHPSAIPGIGDMQPRTPTSPSMGQTSPALPPDLNPSMIGGHGMNFKLQPPLGSDQPMYRPMDMSPLSQQQQHQHRQPHQQHHQQLQQQNMMGMHANQHMQAGGAPKPKPVMLRFGEPPQLPVSTSLMPSMNSQQMPPGVGQASPSMHMSTQMHHHPQQQQQFQQEQQQQFRHEQPPPFRLEQQQQFRHEQQQQQFRQEPQPQFRPDQQQHRQEQQQQQHRQEQQQHRQEQQQQQHRQEQQQHRQEQQQHHLRDPHMMQDQQQQRLNIQHHDSLSKLPPSMLSSPHPRPQGQSNLDSFGSSPGPYESLQQPVGPGRTNVNLITVPIQDEGPYPPMPAMVGQSQGSNLPFSPTRPILSQNFSQPELSPGMNRPPNFGNHGVGNNPRQSPNLGGGGGGGNNVNQPMPFPQPPGNIRMNNLLNTPPGLNNIQASALAMFQTLTRPNSGSGLMPLPRPSNQGLVNPRFNPTNWASGNPRSLPPRMPQNQQRPRGGGDGQFKQNYF